MIDDDRRLLDFAARTYRDRGAHADAVRTELGLSVTRYWQRIGRLLDNPEALAHNPTLTNRLRRITRR
ncbi:DUF3263 domain-containing protein [Gordonia sihwensis]|uniref:DUF3263 domain-containing protein n=1 Tax=Gordonia sihwensis TaxID=173559 RepID=UPI0024176936|nr:DUF3263 domain-containing protein [Gordonia sihwensis]WFN91517.1 DUF3263 domain-containing protein [Gordonia sihwensis]WFN91575.1 DUF3263 domain-containing protein [Gordonia sihwensis]